MPKIISRNRIGEFRRNSGNAIIIDGPSAPSMPDDKIPYCCLLWTPPGSVLGSGVVIGKHWILTAKHNLGADHIFVSPGVGSAAEINYRYPVEERIPYDQGNPTEFDCVLLQVQEAIDSKYFIACDDSLGQALNAAKDNPKLVRIGGFGHGSIDSAGMLSGEGERRYGDGLLISEFHAGDPLKDSSFLVSDLPNHGQDLDIATYDSGGPIAYLNGSGDVLIGIAIGNYNLAGVLPAPEICGRVSYLREWIHGETGI
jgi:hypothetical protein